MKSLILLLFPLLFIAAGCNSPTDSGFTSLHKVSSDGQIEYSLDINSNTFLPSDTLYITFKVKNNSLTIKQFNFANIQQLAFEIIDIHNNVVMFYPWVVSPATSNFIVYPGETKELNLVSGFRNQYGNYITPGKYILAVFLADGNSPKLKLEITIK